MLRSAAVLLALLASPAFAQSLPDSLVGGWGLSFNDCAAGPGSEGYLEVTPTTLTFYESQGTLQMVTSAAGDPGVIADFAFSGEGDTWTRTMYLEAQNDGQTLVRLDKGEDGGVPVAYVACN